jgi:tyrosyl-tRNA synthetase
MVSREIARAYGAPNTEIVLTTPLLEGTDGVQKMSKSYGNYIGITEPPLEMFGKLMSISDELMWRYWTLLTDTTAKEIDEMRANVGSGSLHPMQAKKDLARQIVGDFHSGNAAQQAEADWAKQFQKHETPQDLPLREIPLSQVAAASDNSAIRVDKLLVASGLSSSGAEAQRKIKEGAVHIDNEVVNHPTLNRQLPNSFVVRLGKRMIKVSLKSA